MIRVIRYWRPADGSIDWEKAHDYTREHKVPPEFLGFIRRWLEPNKGDLFPPDHEVVGYYRSRQQLMAWVWWRPVTVEGRSECRALELTGADLDDFEGSGRDVYRLLGIAEAGAGAFPRSGGAWPSYLGAAAASYRSRFGPGRPPSAPAYLSLWDERRDAPEAAEIEYRWQREAPGGLPIPRSRVTHESLQSAAMEAIEREAQEAFRRQAGWDRDLPPLPGPVEVTPATASTEPPPSPPSTPASPAAPIPGSVPVAAAGQGRRREERQPDPELATSGSGSVDARIEALRLEIRNQLQQVESRWQSVLDRSVPEMIQAAVQALRSEVAAMESRWSAAAKKKPSTVAPPVSEESIARLRTEIEALRRDSERARREPVPAPVPREPAPAPAVREPGGTAGGRGVERVVLGICVVLSVASVSLALLSRGGQSATGETLAGLRNRVTEVEKDVSGLRADLDKGLASSSEAARTAAQQLAAIQARSNAWNEAATFVGEWKRGVGEIRTALGGLGDSVEAIKQATNSWVGRRWVEEQIQPVERKLERLSGSVTELKGRLDALGAGASGGKASDSTNARSGGEAGAGSRGNAGDSRSGSGNRH